METILTYVVIISIVFAIGYTCGHMFPWKKPVGLPLTKQQMLYIGLGDVVRQFSGGKITKEDFLTRYQIINRKIVQHDEGA